LADVENEVMCPVCGTPLGLATEAPQAEREREFIRRQVDDCRSKDEIKAALVDEFGQNVLALPGTDGFDLAAYLVPGLAVLLGGGAVAATAVGWRRSRPRVDQDTDGSGPADLGAAQRDRLQTDLDRYDL
jgi:cytochrome c-type biogenesis protein CcmH